MEVQFLRLACPIVIIVGSQERAHGSPSTRRAKLWFTPKRSLTEVLRFSKDRFLLYQLASYQISSQ